MKRLVVLLLFLTVGNFLKAQNIYVRSFKALTNDMSARVDNPKFDRNGEKCAIIKIVTSASNFEWNVSPEEIISIEKKTGEYWLYVQNGVRTISIQHEKLGMLSSYLFPEPIKPAMVYELVLTNSKIETAIINTDIFKKWISITSDPNGANFFLNDSLLGSTPLQFEILPGKNQYRIEKKNYHTSAGTLMVRKKDSSNRITLKLQPKFGSLKLTSLPENGADIYINNKYTGSKTPALIEEISSGPCDIVLKKELYQSLKKTVQIEDGKSIRLNLQMTDNSCSLTVNTSDSSLVKIDDKDIGIGIQTVRVSKGIHNISISKKGYLNINQQIDLNNKTNYSIHLCPLPLLGELQIGSQPIEADIYIDGIKHGQSPLKIPNISLGKHTLTLKKSGGWRTTKRITIVDDKTQIIDIHLSNLYNIKFTSLPTKASIIVDGVNKGNTPIELNLPYGEHTIKVKHDKNIFCKNIDIKQFASFKTDSTIKHFDLRDLNIIKEVIEGVKVEFVEVKGSTYKFGFEKNKKYSKGVPINIKDFYLSKFEIPEQLFRKVMNLKGNTSAILPITNISLSKIKTFISKINKITGKKFRLPTEAEWEYAAKGGVYSQGYEYSGSDDADSVGWYTGNGNIKKISGLKDPNELNIYDMSGNVWEFAKKTNRSFDYRFQALICGGSYSCRYKRDLANVKGRKYITKTTYSDVGFRLVLEK